MLKISNAKIGGSPMYYLAGQESQLEVLYDKLNDKQKKAYDLLKSNLILKENDQEPVIRIALRDIKDFAIPLDVSFNNENQRYWKWHLVPDDEASFLIKKKLGLIKSSSAPFIIFILVVIAGVAYYYYIKKRRKRKK